MEYRDYYAVLGVPKGASDKEIKQAYRKLARQYHPDVNPNDKGAEARFRQINEAYTVLSDSEKRKRYDELGSNWDKVEQSPRRGGAPGGFSYQFSTSPEGFGDIFGGSGGGFSDFFQTFFGGGGEPINFGGGSRIASSAPVYEIEISLEDAYQGTTKSVVLPIEMPCPECGGRGTVRRTLCRRCRGQGTIQQEKRVELKIPKGIREGQTLRLHVEGQEIHIKVKFAKHPLFKVLENGNLSCEMSVPFLDLILGGELSIPTLQGKTVVNVPPGTQNGATLRLKGLGMPQSGKNGDLLLTLKAVFPTTLSAEEKKLYQEAKRLQEVKR